MFHSMQVGSVDHELYLMRILLSRALAREAKLNGQLQLREVTQNSDAGASVPRKSRSLKVADCSADIDRLIGRIESLEKTRMALAE